MVGLGRFELPTSPLSGVRSNQLSYRPGNRPLKMGMLSPAATRQCFSNGFEDIVERAEQLSRSGPSVLILATKRRFSSGSPAIPRLDRSQADAFRRYTATS